MKIDMLRIDIVPFQDICSTLD